MRIHPTHRGAFARTVGPVASPLGIARGAHRPPHEVRVADRVLRAGIHDDKSAAEERDEPRGLPAAQGGVAKIAWFRGPPIPAAARPSPIG